MTFLRKFRASEAGELSLLINVENECNYKIVILDTAKRPFAKVKWRELTMNDRNQIREIAYECLMICRQCPERLLKVM